MFPRVAYSLFPAFYRIGAHIDDPSENCLAHLEGLPDGTRGINSEGVAPVFSNRRMSLKGRVWTVAEESSFLGWILRKSSSRSRGGGNVESAPLVFTLSKEPKNPH